MADFERADAEVQVQRNAENKTMLVVLNRVKKLNALNLNMVKSTCCNFIRIR